MLNHAAPHRCTPSLPLRVRQAQNQGFFEAYHERERSLAQARAAVATRAGYQTMVEETSDGGFIVLAKPTIAVRIAA